MLSEHCLVPERDDLMKWHLYIGYCQEDRQAVQSLYQSLHELVHTAGLTCYFRSSLDAVELSAELNVEEGINFSQRCLLYISPAYIKDCWSEYELHEADRKVKYFGRKSVVALIESSVDQRHLDKFSQFTKITQPFHDEELLTELVSGMIFASVIIVLVPL